MEEKATLIESLLEKVESYVSTSLELFKLKAVDSLADIVSTLVSNIVIIISVLLCIILGSIGLAFWIGKLIDNIYYGFFIVAGLYLTISLLVYLLRKSLIKNAVSNSIINQILNGK